MMNTQNKNSNGLLKTLCRFTDVVSGIGVLFLAPYVTTHFREPMYAYLLTAFDSMIAYWGSWLFVVLVIAGAYFGGSMVLQMIIHSLYRWITTRDTY